MFPELASTMPFSELNILWAGPVGPIKDTGAGHPSQRLESGPRHNKTRPRSGSSSLGIESLGSSRSLALHSPECGAHGCQPTRTSPHAPGRRPTTGGDQHREGNIPHPELPDSSTFLPRSAPFYRSYLSFTQSHRRALGLTSFQCI